MSDEIVERGKLQPPGVGGTNEEDPFLPQQRLVGKIAEARPLVIAERGKECVALAPEDQLQGASPRKLLKRGFLVHGGEDVLEDFGAEPRRLDVGQVLKRYQLIGDELQGCGRRCRSAECPGGSKGHAEKSAEPSPTGFSISVAAAISMCNLPERRRGDAELHEDRNNARRSRSSIFSLQLLLLVGSKVLCRPLAAWLLRSFAG
jgi:hypothetical protein